MLIVSRILPSRSYKFYCRLYALCLVLVGAIACAPTKEKPPPLKADEEVLAKALTMLYNPDVTDKKPVFVGFEKACKLGSRYGCHAVGTTYNNGLYGKKQDYRQALLWYEKAARKGYIPSQLNIANIYAHRLLPMNDKEGYFWLALAKNNLQLCPPGSIEVEPDTSDLERRRKCKHAEGFYRKLFRMFRKRMSAEEIVSVEKKVKEKLDGQESQ